MEGRGTGGPDAPRVGWSPLSVPPELRHLLSVLSDEHDIVAILARGAQLTRTTVDRVVGAGVALERDGSSWTVYDTGSEVGEHADPGGDDRGDPVSSCLSTGRIVHHVVGSDDREARIVFALPLAREDDARARGALWVRLLDHAVPAASDLLVLRSVADVCRAALDHHDPEDPSARSRLERAVAGRALVERACDVLSTTHQVRLPTAFAILRDRAAITVTDLLDVAGGVIAPSRRHSQPGAPEDDRSSAAPSSAFDDTTVAMAIADPHGTVTASNEALAALLGRSPADVVGLSLVSVTHAEDVVRAVAACRSLEDPDVLTSDVEVRLLRPDGAVVHVKVSTAKVTTPERSTSHLVMHLQDVTDHVSSTAALQRLAFQDPLTGLANRALLEDRLEHALNRRDPSPVSVLFIDLDDFKVVNDTFGHRVGDEVLRAVAADLHRVVRADSTVARIGGDEFVVVCENTTATEAHLVAERLAEALAANSVLEETSWRLSASIGVASTDDRDDDWPSHHALLDAADSAMYRAKRRHRRLQPGQTPPSVEH